MWIKVIVENGITYVLGEGDIYYPDLQLPERTNYNIGKFGHMRCEYLKEFRHEIYMSDARKVAPEKWRTVIRHPIKKV